MTLLKGMVLLTDFREWEIPHEKFAVVLGEDEFGMVEEKELFFYDRQEIIGQGCKYPNCFKVNLGRNER